jgi:phage-related tail fiber protein
LAFNEGNDILYYGKGEIDGHAGVVIKIGGSGAFLTLAGGTMIGAITLNADPNSALHAATKQYVDNVAQGLNVKQSVKAATTANLGSISYSNGSSGVGATITNASTMVPFPAQDNVTLNQGSRLLVKNQQGASQNGIYTLTTVGNFSENWVLTRATDFDVNKNLPGSFVFVEEGTTQADSGWVCTTDHTITIGTTGINFSQFSGAGQITAGAGLTKSGNILDVVSTGDGSLTITGDSINLTSGIATAGIYRSVTVDTYGRVTAGTTPTTFSGYGISDTATNLAAALGTSATGSGNLVLATSPTLTTPLLGTPTSGNLSNCTNIPVNSVTGILPVANGGTGVNTSTGTGSVVLSAGPTFTGTVNAANITLSGNLIVNGTTTTVNSTTVTLDDPIITLGGDVAPTSDDSKDRGVEFRWHTGSAARLGFFGFDDSTGYFTFIPDATNNGEVFSGTLGDIQAGNFRGNLITDNTTIDCGTF